MQSHCQPWLLLRKGYITWWNGKRQSLGDNYSLLLECEASPQAQCSWQAWQIPGFQASGFCCLRTVDNTCDSHRNGPSRETPWLDQDPIFCFLNYTFVFQRKTKNPTTQIGLLLKLKKHAEWVLHWQVMCDGVCVHTLQTVPFKGIDLLMLNPIFRIAYKIRGPGIWMQGFILLSSSLSHCFLQWVSFGIAVVKPRDNSHYPEPGSATHPQQAN